MKRFLLGLVFVAGLCLNVDAANPSFSSFATNQFITNNFLIRVRLNPAQFDTNASSVTITLTNVAGVPGGGTLWTNSAGVLQPLGHTGGSNQFTIAEASGWTGTGTNAFFDDGTFSGVAVINPTDGYLPYRVNAYEFGDSPWHTNNVNLLLADYGGTNVLAIGNDGTLMPGVASSAYYGSSPSLALGFFNDTDTGGSGAFEITAGGGSASGTRQAYVDFAGDNRSALVSANTYFDNGDNITASASATTNELTGFYSSWNSTNLISLRPFWPDQLNVAAHTLDTWIPYSQGYLLALKNNQTNQLSFGPNAKILFHGFDDLSTTNYSLLAILHTGPNGAVLLDSRSAGTAGSPVPFMFAQNGVVSGWISQTNLALGYNALKLGTNITQNVAIGPNAISALTNGTQNVAVGFQAGISLKNNNDNTLVGFNAGSSLTSGGNTIVGSGTASGLTTGTYNTAIGHQAAYGNKTGNHATTIGMQAGAKATNLFQSTIVGAHPLNGLESATNTLIQSVWLGYKDSTITNWNGAYTNVVIIGHNLMPTNSNEIIIGNTNNTVTYLPPSLMLRGITKAQKTALTPQEGMVVFQTDTTPGLRVYQGGAWVMVSTVADP